MQRSPYAYELILFDLDGTLVETGADISHAVNDVLSEAGLEPIDQSQIERWIGMGTRKLMAMALASRWGMPADAAMSDARFESMITRFGECYLRRSGAFSRPYPHVMQTLMALREQSVKLVVLTNKETRFAQPLLDFHGLSPWFDDVICGDTYPVKKPHPLGVQASMQKWEVGPQQTLLVGDSSIDVATARQAGIAVWVLPYGYNMGEPIESCGADRVIPDLSALLPSA